MPATKGTWVRTRLRLGRSTGEYVDLVVTTDTGASVADVAEAIVRADPGALPTTAFAGPVTLRLTPPDGGDAWTLHRDLGLVDAGLRAGSSVVVVPASDRFAAPGDPREAGSVRLRVVAGPAAGFEVDLPDGVTTIGRMPGCDVRLADPLVSKRHARLVVSDIVEIVDDGSSNGVIVGDGRVQRAVLGPADRVLLGDSVLQVERLVRSTRVGSTAASVQFNRSPLLLARHPDRAVEAPSPPEPAAPGRFPIIAMVAPLLMGVVLLFTMRSAMSLIFIGMSPLIMAGTYFDKRFTDRRRLKVQTAEYVTALAAVDVDLEAGQVVERAARLSEVPSTSESVKAGWNLSPVLWSRRPEHESFLTVRLGTGTAPSRTTLTLPARGKASAEHWKSLEDLRDKFVQVAGVPITVDLRETGALGLAGPAGVVDDVARGLVAQLACLHSPAELVLTAIASAQSCARWDWLKWLPHVASPLSPLGGAHLTSSPAAGLALVVRLEELVAARRAIKHGDDPALPAIVVVVQDDAPVDRGRLVRLAEDGPEVGLHVVWVAAKVPLLPAACRSFLVLGDEPGVAAAGFVRAAQWAWDVSCEPVTDQTATALAHRLTAVDDAGAPIMDESDLPRAVSYLALAGPEIAVDPQSIVETWRETGSLLDRSGNPPVRRRHDGTLRALVGQGADRDFMLDLRTQGPHALVGGTTGAGKSEFLQAWVLGMAAAHSPDRVSFLFVDYKGGAAFAECVDLPHTVGLVTDLSPHLVRRALTSLRAELRRREQLLNRKKAKDLLALERTGDPETPPALVIVVDEFAALVSEVPEFVDGVVDVAQRGRSLGLHLILATQRPAGVIKDNLRANTNLRVALRMADEHDSVDVLGSPVASGFDPAMPGRGAVRTGPGRIAMFQTGYVGGRSGIGAAPQAPVALETLTFGPGEPWDVPPADDAVDAVDEDGPTDIARTVVTIAAAARLLSLPAPRKPWLPELAAVCDLETIASRSDVALVFGMADEPDHQRQRSLMFRPDQDGSLVVFGTSGAGKSTTLRTLAIAAALTIEPVHVYGLDFGSGGLSMLERLPNVGSVVDGADTERVARLLGRLREVVTERSGRFAQAQAGSITEYRARSGRPDEPRVLLLVDGLSAFREAYESQIGRGELFAVFARLVAEGRPLGVHVAMSAERPGALPTSLAGSVQRRLVLRQADENAYGVLGIPKDVLAAEAPAGRGVVAGTNDEVQVAVVGGSASIAAQVARLNALAEIMETGPAAFAPPIRRLPAVIEASSLPDSVGGMPVLGVADDTLQACGFEPRGVFVLAGLPRSGRTTALGAIAASLHRFDPAARLYYVGSRRSLLATAPYWAGAALTPQDAAVLARGLLAVLAEPVGDGMGVVLVIEGLAEFLGGPAEQALVEAIKAAKRNDHFVLAESETTTWGSAWPLISEVRNGRRGLVLQPDTFDGDALFRTAFPRLVRSEFPPGRGVFVEAGRLRRVQVPLPG